MNEELLKSLSGAIDMAIQQLVSVDQLAKSDVSLQDAKLRPETANGTLPGDNREESALKPEDAKKAEDEAAKADAAAKGENPFADKDDDKKDADKDGKDKKKKDSDDSDDDDLDDEKAEKMKAKIKKYEDDKAAKAALPGTSMIKSEAPSAEELTKSIVTQVSEAMQKSFGERLSQLEGLIQKVVTTPQPRQSVSGLAPLAKSSEDVQPAGQAAAPALTKASALDQLFAMQKSEDKRVDSSVIARVEMGDFSVLSERNINLK